MDIRTHPVLSLGAVSFGLLIFIYMGALALLPTPHQETWTPPDPVVHAPLPQPAPNSHTLVFVGDIMLGRHVERLMQQQGPMYPFAGIADDLHNVQTLVGNLEGPIPSTHIPTPDFNTQFSFEESVADTLASVGFDVLALGNNHLLDQGQDDYLHTREVLADRGIDAIGHPTIVDPQDYATVADGEVILLSFNMTFPSNSSQEIIDATKQVSEAHPRAVVVPQVHWGQEYQLTSSAAQQELAHALVDAGARVVIGHHPHVTQEIERYKDGLIFYSLGNFVFDQYFSSDVQEGLIVSMRVNDASIDVGALPITLPRSQPQIATGNVRNTLMQAVLDRSPTITEDLTSGTIRLERTP